MVKKHKRSSKAWMSHLDNMYDVFSARGQENVDVGDIAQRALQSIHKRKHLKILTHHGILMFKKGALEKGRTVFEAIIGNYPKR